MPLKPLPRMPKVLTEEPGLRDRTGTIMTEDRGELVSADDTPVTPYPETLRRARQIAAATVGARAGELGRDQLAVIAFWSDAAASGPSVPIKMSLPR